MITTRIFENLEIPVSQKSTILRHFGKKQTRRFSIVGVSPIVEKAKISMRSNVQLSDLDRIFRIGFASRNPFRSSPSDNPFAVF